MNPNAFTHHLPGAAEKKRLSGIPSKQPHAVYVFWLALVLFLAFALRLWQLGAQSLWHDEAWSIFSAYHPLATGLLGTDPNAPPIFYLSLGAWMQFAGDGVWALRYWSLLIGLITVAVAALVANRLFGRRTALIAAFLTALSPILWTYSQEIRAYESMPLYALILLGLVDQLLRARSRRVWIWLLLVEILALYTQNLSVPLIAWLNVTVITLWLYRRRWGPLRRWVVAQFFLALAYLPWLLSQSPTGTALNTTPPIDIATAVAVLLSYFTGVKALLTETVHWADYRLFTSALWVLGVIVGIAILFDLVWPPKRLSILDHYQLRRLLARSKVRTQALVYSQMYLLPIFSLGELYAAHIDFHPRYFILGAFSFVLFLAMALADLSKRGRIGQFFTSVALACGVLTSALALGYITSDGRFQHDDFRAIAERYATLGADDAIVIPYGWEPTLDYYSHKLNFKAQIIGIPLGSDWRTIVSRLNTIHAKHLEVLTWYQLPADVRGAYACLLGASTDAPPEIFTVNGLTTVRYDQPEAITPELLNGLFSSFGTLNQEQSVIVANARRVCVIEDWSADKPPLQPLGINIELDNLLGWSLGQASSDLRTNQQVPTQYWRSGQSGTSFALVEFPPGLAPGDYPLLGSVYDSTTLRKLDMLNKSGAPSGQLAPLGTAALVPGDLGTPPAYAQIISDSWRVVYSSNGMRPSDNCSLQPGQQWQISALWWTNQPGAQPQTAILQASSDDWPGVQPSNQSVAIPAKRHSALTWAAITIPASIKAPISLNAIAPDGSHKTVVQCTVKASDHLYNPPAIGTPFSADFPGIGILIGYDLSSTTLSHTDFQLTLYWKATETAATAYTVFVHLLNSAGQVIAQNDSPPANGSHPTTGWLNSEYITDPHTLTFNAAGQGYSGPATVEVGLYYPATGQRVLVNNGADHVALPANVRVN